MHTAGSLRHTALRLAERATGSRSRLSIIPLLVNLKELRRSPDELIDRNLIEKFVLQSLTRANDREVTSFLEEEFEAGMKAGTWLFLFDSFDEIPEILSATEQDASIGAYSEAISDFLHGMNACRGVLASRKFRGPGGVGWPRFRVVRLTLERQHELIHRADLPRDVEAQLLENVSTSAAEFRALCANPMFLGMLCEHARQRRIFPTSSHAVFESFVQQRFDRDAHRIIQRFGIEPGPLRTHAEAE